jgi:prepilin-type N-terminal cleavage/methylation domain-containing protein
MKKTKKNKGFTLIEILVVIGLIAILAAVVLIAINPARQFRQANNSQRTANVNAILNAIGQYTADNKGSLPAGIPTSGSPADISGSLCDILVTSYLPALPTDPEVTTYKGEPIEEADCDDLDISGRNSGYEVISNDGRVTVSAPLAKNVETGNVDDDLISVTR